MLFCSSVFPLHHSKNWLHLRSLHDKDLQMSGRTYQGSCVPWQDLTCIQVPKVPCWILSVANARLCKPFFLTNYPTYSKLLFCLSVPDEKKSKYKPVHSVQQFSAALLSLLVPCLFQFAELCFLAEQAACSAACSARKHLWMYTAVLWLQCASAVVAEWPTDWQQYSLKSLSLRSPHETAPVDDAVSFGPATSH